MYVEWEDSLGCPGGWENMDDKDFAAKETSICHSVGWVVNVKKGFVVLVPNRTQNRCAMGTITIPQRCITKVVGVKGPPAIKA